MAISHDMKHAFIPPPPLQDELCRLLYRENFPQPSVRAVGSNRYVRGAPQQPVVYRPQLEELLVWIDYLAECAYAARSAVCFKRTERGGYSAETPAFPELRAQGASYAEAAAWLGIKIARAIRPTKRKTNITDIRKRRRR